MVILGAHLAVASLASRAELLPATPEHGCSQESVCSVRNVACLPATFPLSLSLETVASLNHSSRFALALFDSEQEAL